MRVVGIANMKGGSGKTTASLLLATELAGRGETVALLDCDPQGHLTQWRLLERSADQPPVFGNITTAGLPNLLRRLSENTGVTVIDLSGASDVLAAMCFGLSDLVLVPLQGSAMDARGASRALELVRYVAQNAQAPVRQAILLSRVSPIAATRSLRHAIETLRAARVQVLDTPLVERGAYRAVFDHGGALATLPAALGGNIANARCNAAQFADDVLAMLDAGGEGRKPAPFSSLCFRQSRPDLADAALR
ncbi:chromosome partitioning protein [Rhizobium sp. RU20A]|uniref:ParA family protein n=1 Tax=Rhizobium sp. RU20A TaxID=1907412 RepID=UPI00095538CB|nr:ParA family protein [Rhizobium sp. RU20A]SIQ22222.1 chromosome partitioning protein [Rhizobium sp. RU20A]